MQNFSLVDCPLIKSIISPMESSSLSILLLFSFLLLLLDVPQSHFYHTTAQPPKCHQEERNALLEFKATFYEESCNDPRMETWTVEDENGDCCNWSGLDCDEHSGHVIDLYLGPSCLSGSINSSSSIFKLTHLRTLSIWGNDFRYSKIPSAISNLSRLESLYLFDSNFSGQIPSEILNLTNLSYLALGSPQSSSPQLTLKNPSLRDLVQSLLKLEHLQLDSVEISSSVPDSLSRLTSLRELILVDCKLQGQVSPSVINLTELEWLDLSYNQFTGEIFPHLLTLTELSTIALSSNKFSGQIPRTISHLKKLGYLYLDSNDFNEKTHLDVFFQLDWLQYLDLSDNNFSFVIDSSSIKPRSKLQHLTLASCKLNSFPLLLQSQDSLEYLDLSSNDISGEVPQWFVDVTKENLIYLNLSHNHFSGSLPIPSTNSSLRYYIASNNEFSGELRMRMCHLVNIIVFDIANNNISDMIPQCLANLVGMGELSVLNLQNNSFNGPIPQVGKNRCNLAMIDVSYNQLDGPVPRDMENCSNLEFLNLGNNKITNVFPFWLGKLPTLSILILRSNRFHGIIGKPFDGYEFPKLQVITLFNNSFTGCLPSQYFEGWMAMKVDAHKEDPKMLYASHMSTNSIELDYFYSIVMINKRISVDYTKIPVSLVGIDLSSNYFTGEIPKCIATLKALHFLNLSNNMLIGLIPSNLNGLIDLESLDLSHNKLFGELPQRLTDLIALESFDVSFNQLTGPITQSKQFSTFESSSYEGNLGLCGPPLLRKCGDFIEPSPPPSSEKDHLSRNWIEIDWKVVSMGYSSGFVIGVVMGMKWSRECKNVKRVRQIKFVLN